ncbi:MAG: hypothetical protein IKL49_06670 [Lachnospiraceae bacterium]|nr:hypothetical protein [Lachnospiraceae bacterium]
MANESGTWIMYGVSEDDHECIHTVEQAIEYINEIGFLPLFKNEIPGFSLEERTVPEYWWSGDVAHDPWEWREIITRTGQVAYGKFFDKKAGFISQEWLPYFANYRRDGYDFDALWDDEKASMKQKKIMDLFAEENADAELYSFEVKQRAGFGKGGEKNFDGTVTDLEMKTYLCIRDFRQRKNKKGEAYGWAIAVYATPEHIFGYKHVTSAYKEEPVESGKRIVKHMMEVYPIATVEQIRKVIGAPAGEPIKKEKKAKKVDYPANLFKDLNLEIKNPTADQMYGLEFVLVQLKDIQQEVIHLRYEQGLTFKAIGEQIGRSGGRCSQICKQGLRRLENAQRQAWMVEGYEGRIARLGELADKCSKEFLAEGKTEQAALLVQAPDSLLGITANQAKQLMKAGVFNIAALREIMNTDFGIWSIPGIGEMGGRRIVNAMFSSGLIDESFEAYKEMNDRTYRQMKFLKMRDLEEE